MKKSNCNKKVDLELLLKYWEKFYKNIHYWRRLLLEVECPKEQLTQIYRALLEKMRQSKNENIPTLIDLAHKLWGHPNFPHMERRRLFNEKWRLLNFPTNPLFKPEDSFSFYDRPGENREETIPF